MIIIMVIMILPHPSLLLLPRALSDRHDGDDDDHDNHNDDGDEGNDGDDHNVGM